MHVEDFPIRDDDRIEGLVRWLVAPGDYVIEDYPIGVCRVLGRDFEWLSSVRGIVLKLVDGPSGFCRVLVDADERLLSDAPLGSHCYTCGARVERYPLEPAKLPLEPDQGTAGYWCPQCLHGFPTVGLGHTSVDCPGCPQVIPIFCRFCPSCGHKNPIG